MQQTDEELRFLESPLLSATMTPDMLAFRYSTTLEKAKVLTLLTRLTLLTLLTLLALLTLLTVLTLLIRR